MATVRRRRIRRVLKWGGLVLSLVIVMAWGVSLLGIWRYCTDATEEHSDEGLRCYDVIIMHGQLIVDYAPWDDRTGWQFVRYQEDWESLNWWPHVETDDGWSVSTPLWMLFVTITLPTAYLWWRDRRIPPGHCQRCGYNLTGNVSGVCSECGTPLPENRPGR